MDADVIERIIGTDRFTVEDAGWPSPPAAGEALRGGSCLIDFDDDRLIMRVAVKDDRTLETEREDLSRTAPTDELDGGTARVTEKGASWICGNV